MFNPFNLSEKQLEELLSGLNHANSLAPDTRFNTKDISIDKRSPQVQNLSLLQKSQEGHKALSVGL